MQSLPTSQISDLKQSKKKKLNTKQINTSALLNSDSKRQSEREEKMRLFASSTINQDIHFGPPIKKNLYEHYL